MIRQLAAWTFSRTYVDLRLHICRDFESCSKRTEVRQRIRQSDPHLAGSLAYLLFEGQS